MREISAYPLQATFSRKCAVNRIAILGLETAIEQVARAPPKHASGA
jgi:hypothetical protein